MPFFYRCNVEYTDPNDLLRKGFNVYTSFSNDVSQFIVLAQTRKRALSLIKQYKISPEPEQISESELDITITSCEEGEQ